MKILAKPVRMIAVFDEQGVPNPLRFRIEEGGVNDGDDLLTGGRRL